MARYYLIDFLLHNNEYVKTNLIVDYCEQKIGYKVSTRTIQMDINAMKNDSFLGFYAPISYCNIHKAYYYLDTKYKLLPFHFTSEEVNLIDSLLQKAKLDHGEKYEDLINRIMQKMRLLMFDP